MGLLLGLLLGLQLGLLLDLGFATGFATGFGVCGWIATALPHHLQGGFSTPSVNNMSGGVSSKAQHDSLSTGASHKIRAQKVAEKKISTNAEKLMHAG